MTYFILSGRTLPLLLWLVLRRKPVCVIKVIAEFPGFGPLLERLVGQLQHRGHARPLEDELPELTRYTGLDFFANTNFRYDRIEDWVERTFGFDVHGPVLGDLAIAYKKVIWAKVYSLAQCAIVIQRLLETKTENDFKVLGTTGHMSEIYQNHYGRPLPDRAPVVRPEIPHPATNFLITVLAIFHASAWIAVRMRFRVAAPEDTFFGTNLTSIYKLSEKSKPYFEAVGDHSKIRLILNTPAMVDIARGNISDIHYGLRGDGRYTVSEGFALAAATVVAMVRFQLHFGGYPAMFFIAIILLPFKRAVYRGLFNRYRFSYFFLSNEYSEESAVLASEARRVGCTVMGRIHGVPVTEILQPVWRHIDMDICYLPLKIPFATDYRRTWPEAMTLRPVRSRGLIERRRQQANTAKSNDIVFFFNAGIYLEQTTETVLAVARAFPDRTVYLGVKGNRVVEKICADMVAELTVAEENIVKPDALSYDLMLMGSYAFVDFSTIAIEAVQFGLNTFVLDFRPEDQPLLYRQLPDFCVRSPEEAIERIWDLESGQCRYPKEQYEKIMGLSEKSISEAMAEDLYGTPPNSAVARIV